MTTAYEPPAIPHLAATWQLGPDGDFEYLEQDTPEEIAQSVAVLVGTMTGQRTVAPAYGVVDPTFQDPDPAAIEQAVGTWEKRAKVAVTVLPPGSSAQVTIEVAPAAPSS